MIALFPLLVGALALADRGPAMVLARPWAVYGGRISYALYLVHIPMFEVYWTALQHVRALGPHTLLAHLVGTRRCSSRRSGWPPWRTAASRSPPGGGCWRCTGPARHQLPAGMRVPPHRRASRRTPRHALARHGLRRPPPGGHLNGLGWGAQPALLARHHPRPRGEGIHSAVRDRVGPAVPWATRRSDRDRAAGGRLRLVRPPRPRRRCCPSCGPPRRRDRSLWFDGDDIPAASASAGRARRGAGVGAGGGQLGGLWTRKRADRVDEVRLGATALHGFRLGQRPPAAALGAGTRWVIAAQRPAARPSPWRGASRRFRRPAVRPFRASGRGGRSAAGAGWRRRRARPRPASA